MITDPTPAVDDFAETVGLIRRAGLVAVLRAPDARHLMPVSECLVEAGIACLEVTLTTQNAVASIEQLATAFGKDVLVGAGSVTTTDEAEAALDAGAQFLVSPAYCADVLATARIAGVPAIPGALTPSEILAAQRSGAPLVKLFPATTVSPEYVRHISAPLPEVRLMPTGGVRIDDITAWLTAGAAAVGLGGSLIGTAMRDGVDPALTERARRARDLVAAARGDS